MVCEYIRKGYEVRVVVFKIMFLNIKVVGNDRMIRGFKKLKVLKCLEIIIFVKELFYYLCIV